MLNHYDEIRLLQQNIYYTPIPDSDQLSFESVHIALGITLDETFQAWQVHLDFQFFYVAMPFALFPQPATHNSQLVTRHLSRR